MICPSCHKEVSIVDNKVGFRDDCPHCGADLHSCAACGFFDPGSYNDCRETQADRVVDKEKSNFCEYYQPGGSGNAGGGLSPAEEAKRKLEELFKKK